mmetsp:Transcript_31368/g.56818  ORF Transcript_31368/g.56818 Transcript_31368/m.56818 type:complete len:207 (-) Transcript_31368:662-1282(-)
MHRPLRPIGIGRIMHPRHVIHGNPTPQKFRQIKIQFAERESHVNGGGIGGGGVFGFIGFGNGVVIALFVGGVFFVEFFFLGDGGGGDSPACDDDAAYGGSSVGRVGSGGVGQVLQQHFTTQSQGGTRFTVAGRVGPTSEARDEEQNGLVGVIGCCFVIEAGSAQLDVSGCGRCLFQWRARKVDGMNTHDSLRGADLPNDGGDHARD